MKKIKFNHMLALISTVSMIAGSQSVYAQQAEAAEEVIITGFKASLEKAQEVKKSSSSIVEAIAAEDIGKLPDTSIAESLARLPGLAGNRVGGRTSGLSLRGFNENYVATTMNGRELLGIGDNRGVEYDLYPSEIISGATIYKTPDATLINQGLGGIVNLQTMRPLDHAPVLALSGNLEQNGLKSANPDFDDHGYRTALTYADKFADDTIGVAITAAKMHSPSQEEQFRGWGYADATVDGSPVKVLGGLDNNVRSSMMDRDTIAGVFQFRPNDQLDITVDALHIKFKEDKVFRGLEEGGPVWSGANWAADKVENGLVTAGHFDGFDSVIRNDGDTKTGTLDTYGFNAKYLINDTWTAVVDVATGKSKKDVLDIESYSGVGRAGRPDQGGAAARSWVMTNKGAFYSAHPNPALVTPDYSDFSSIYLAGPQAWGGGASASVETAANPFGYSDQQDGFINSPSFHEKLDTFRFDLQGDVKFSIVNGVDFGIAYSDRSKNKRNYGAYLTAPDYFGATGETVLAGDFKGLNISHGQGLIPESYRVGTADLGVFGLGKIVAYRGADLYRDGYYKSANADAYQADRLGDTYEINEKVTTAFGELKLETGIMTGNVGLQIVQTDQSGTGYATLGNAQGTIDVTPVTDGAKYIQLLPSLNLNFQVADDQIVRFATAKTQSRSRMDELKPNDQITFNFDTAHRTSADPKFSAWGGSTGTTQLKPSQDLQFDLAYEWYFAEDGLLSASYFYKDLQTWNVTGQTVTDFTPYFVAGYHDKDLPAGTFKSYSGISSVKSSGGYGVVQGTEYQANIPLRIVSDYLDGFGIIASAAFMDGQITDPINKQVTSVPGMSKETYQLTLHFEHAGFEARIAARKRDKYLSEAPGLSLALTPFTDNGATLVDAQIGYDFKDSGIASLEGLTITLQAQNLTNEPTKLTEAGDSRMVDQYSNFGANYLLGFNYKFR